MKSIISLAVVVASATLSICGCANNAASPGTADANPSKRVYTQEDLQASGRTQVGPALRQLDPDIQASGGSATGVH